jgi:hypothetical protein
VLLDVLLQDDRGELPGAVRQRLIQGHAREPDAEPGLGPALRQLRLRGLPRARVRAHARDEDARDLVVHRGGVDEEAPRRPRVVVVVVVVVVLIQQVPIAVLKSRCRCR